MNFLWSSTESQSMAKARCQSVLVSSGLQEYDGPMNSWSRLGFSTSRPQRARWKPSCCEKVSTVACHTFPAGELGSSIAAPVVRGMVAISVAGAIVVDWLFMLMLSNCYCRRCVHYMVGN